MLADVKFGVISEKFVCHGLLMAYLHCMGLGPAQVQVMGMGIMGPNILCRNVYTGSRQGHEPESLSPIVPVPFPVLFSCRSCPM